jgi:hypothetical protein
MNQFVKKQRQAHLFAGGYQVVECNSRDT